jgi:hypothetical protein
MVPSEWWSREGGFCSGEGEGSGDKAAGAVDEETTMKVEVGECVSLKARGNEYDHLQFDLIRVFESRRTERAWAMYGTVGFWGL